MLNTKITLFLILIMVIVVSGVTVSPTMAVTYTFPVSAACTASGGVMGDLNHDSLVNAYDIDVVIQISKGLEPYDSCADFDSDGFTGPGDSSQLRQLIVTIKAGLVTPPTAELWENSFYNPYRVPACQTIFGDVNGDLKADYQDVDIMKQMAKGALPPNSCADSDGDGFIGAGDISIGTAVDKGLGDFSLLVRPVISLIGSSRITLEVNNAYAELGATATDDNDQDISTPAADLSSAIVIDSSAINSALVGTYIVTYNVTDSDGNAAIEMKREVKVVDTTKPVITLNGANPQTIARGRAYVELGATATDNYDLTVAVANINASAVNISVAGTYIVTYDFTDSSGNIAVQATRTVNVISPSSGGNSDMTPPYNLSLNINNGEQTTNDRSVNLTIGATDAYQMMISNDYGFLGADWETYATTKAWQLTENYERKNIYAKFKDNNGNVSATISASITLVPPQVPVDGVIIEEDGVVLGEKYVSERDQQLAQIYDDAHYIWPGDTNLLLGYMNTQRNLALEQSMSSKYGSILGSNVQIALGGVGTVNAAAITNFLTYGTKTTLKLGAGERAGVLNSYKAAFSKLPQTEEDWRDAIKIGNGRWPSQTSAEAEARAKVNFEMVYKRSANMANANDNAAVTTMAYGLRPLPRNLNSESAAIKIFKGVFGYYPVKATAWDVVRAIAYSGAKR